MGDKELHGASADLFDLLCVLGHKAMAAKFKKKLLDAQKHMNKYIELTNETDALMVEAFDVIGSHCVPPDVTKK